MKRIFPIILALCIISMSASASSRSIIGIWILDDDATADFMKNSPQWDAQTEKMLPIVFKRMSQVKYVFNDKDITVVQRGKSQTMKYEIKETGDPILLNMKVNEQDVTLKIIFKSDNQIIMKSSATDDMDYYIWKKME